MAPVTHKQRQFLKKLSDQLTMSDVGSMKFVCRDKLGAGLLEKIDNKKPCDLFKLLEQTGIISEHDMSWLRNIFIRIQRSDLASQIPVSQTRFQGDAVDSGSYSNPLSPSGVSPYRSLLKELADELTSDEVDEIKFLLAIPGGKSASIKDGESLLLYMENSEGLSETSLPVLLGVLDDVHRMDLIKKVKTFARNGGAVQVFSPTQPVPPSSLMKPSDFQQPPRGVAPEEESPPSYPMKQPPFGYALIINNETFSGRTKEGEELTKRTGTEVDLKKLKDLWEKLGFVVEAHSNLKAHKMVSVVQDMAKKINEDEVKPSCFVCCIMTHGREGDVYGVDSEPVHINDIIGFFKGNKCLGLDEKPKLFFIQACRGQKKLMADSTLHTGQQESIEVKTDSDASPAEDESFRRHAALDESHFLLGYSTLSGFVSWRSTQKGSWYVASLVTIFDKHFRQEDVMTMMVRVNGEVSKAYTKENYKQCPAPVVTLTQRVYFNTTPSH